MKNVRNGGKKIGGEQNGKDDKMYRRETRNKGTRGEI